MPEMMPVTFKVYRYNPEQAVEGYLQEYKAEVPKGSTVLDGLIWLKGHYDGTLSWRMSCRSAICGSCAMKINGNHKLACNRQITDELEKFGEVVLEPMGNMPVIKDLVTDMSVFWEYYDVVRPWLNPNTDVAPPAKERLVSPEDVLQIDADSKCIQCGACFAACEAQEVDPNFIGPAALAKMHRFVFDVRDDIAEERLKLVNGPGGVWDCVHCFQCVTACPKDVAPMDRIMEMRTEILKWEEEIGENYGTRHMKAFVEDIGKTGWIQESSLPVKTWGITNIRAMLGMIPLAFRMGKKRKLLHPFHFPVPNIDDVKRIYKKLGVKK